MKNSFIITLFLVILNCPICHSQVYADKVYYLIDSLNLDELNAHDQLFIDSALTLYHGTENDLVKINALSIITENLSDNCWHKYNDIQLRLAKKALAKSSLTLADKHQIQKSIAAALGNLGYIFDSQGDMAMALKYYNESLSIYRKINDEGGIANALNNIGYTYGELGDVIKQNDYYLGSLKIKEKIGDQQGIAISLNNIGYVFKSQRNFEKALEYFNRSLHLFKELNDDKKIAVTLNNIGLIYQEQKDYAKARACYDQSLSIREKLHDDYGIAMCLTSIGQLYQSQMQLDSALFYFEKSLSLRQQQSDKKGIAQSLYNMGSVKLTLGHLNIALDDLKQAHLIANELKNPAIISSTAKKLSQTYKELGDYKKSLEYYTSHVEVRDSIMNLKTKTKTYQDHIKYEFEKKELIKQAAYDKEISAMIKEASAHKRIFIVVIIAFFLLGILVLILMNKLRINKKQKNEIEKKNREKETLLKEIHHRVKNNLQIITGLLSLQAQGINNNDIKRLFQIGQDRIKSMSLSHELLYQSDDMGHINYQDYLYQLITNLIHSMKGVDHNIELDIETKDIHLNIDTSVHLGLLINEIITNSLKHAFDNDKAGKITVHLKKMESCYILEIGDNGPGFSDEINPNNVSSLGLKLIYNLAKQLKGNVKRDSSQSGTNYIITFQEINQLE